MAVVDMSWEKVDAEVFPGCDPVALEQWLARPQVERMVHALAWRMAHQLGVEASRVEDLEQEFWIELLRILTNPEDHHVAHRFREGLSVALYAACRARAKKLVESSEWTGSRHLSTTVRRRRLLAVHRSRLCAEWGREPSDVELLASFNQAQSSQRADAARQGVLASPSDLVPLGPSCLDEVDERDVAVSSDDDVPLVRVEAVELVAQVLDAARAEGDVLAVVVQAWLGHYRDDPPWIATVPQIREETGLELRLVRDQLVVARQLCRQVLAERFGITGA